MESKPAKKRQCSACGEEGHTRKSKDCPNNPNVDHTKPDITRILKKRDKSEDDLLTIKNYTRGLIKIDADTRRAQIEHGELYGKIPRSHGLCQEGSQGIMMLAFNYVLNDPSCRQPDAGDLISDMYGLIEGKCVTSTNNAPGSCGGEQGWNTLCHLKANILNDHYKISILRIKHTDERWDEFKPANKDKSKKKERPRLNWKKIFAKFNDNFEHIYEGTFEGIFTPRATEPASEQST
jgi:hypothetical protein